MKILFVGSVVSQGTSDHITLKSKVKPSVAPINFQRNLLKGLRSNDNSLDMTIFSLPPVAMFPKGCFFSWGSRTENVCGYDVHFIPAVNTPAIKQLSIFLSAFVMCFSWGWKNRKIKDKVVLVYGQTLYVAAAQIIACKLLQIKSCNIVTDPIRYRSDYDKQNSISKKIINLQWRFTEKLKKNYSSFIFLTEAMIQDYVTDGKPYIILEGIADLEIFQNIKEPEKAFPPAVMYSGALTEGFGIPCLLESFQKIEGNVQLWLFGAGTCDEQIRRAQENDQRIKYWGKVPWNDLLLHMKEASLLLSVKPVDADHSFYQFPSKLMEYMSSGTPVLSTRVKGIPEEYFEYVYPIENDSVEGFARAISRIITLNSSELSKKGIIAKQFIRDKKNCVFQASRIVSLLSSIIQSENG